MVRWAISLGSLWLSTLLIHVQYPISFVIWSKLSRILLAWSGPIRIQQFNPIRMTNLRPLSRSSRWSQLAYLKRSHPSGRSLILFSALRWGLSAVASCTGIYVENERCARSWSFLNRKLGDSDGKRKACRCVVSITIFFLVCGHINSRLGMGHQPFISHRM
jgi:hypothetical protein